jgi:hypothetical protein
MRSLLILALLAAPALADEPDTEIARRHYQRGRDLYDTGLYAEAVKEFEAAHEVMPTPLLDFNVARCHDRLEHWRLAVDAYERYLQGVPTAADATEVRERVSVLRHRLEEVPHSAVAAAVVVPPSAPSPRHRLRLPALVLGGVAIATLTTGAGLFGNALASGHALEDSCAPNCARSSWAHLPVQQRGGEALLAIGGALVVVDVVLWALDRRK